MNNSIVTEQPIWLIIICLALAFLYSFILYRKSKQFEDLSKFKIKIMSVLRFFSVFIISFLLLSPVIKHLSITIEKPIIVFAQDNSESIILQDKHNQLSEYQQNIENIYNQLSEEYKIEYFSFGEEVSEEKAFEFDQKQTDFSELISEVNNTFFNRNVGALIISSDGIYNKGINPLYSTDDVFFPIYAVGLGDTTVYPDFSISNVRHNKIAFLGNKFPLLIFIDAKKLQGKKTNLKVYFGENQIFSKEIAIKKTEETVIEDVQIEAVAIGVQKYTIKIESLNEEKNKLNNIQEIAIEVLDSRQKILIIANSPHPDIGAIRKSLEDNDNYEIDYFNANDFSGSVKEYNLIILHQIPSLTNSATSLLTEISEKNIPTIFIFGAQSSYNNLNNLDKGLKITHLNNAFDEAQPFFNDNFAIFEIDEDFSSLLKKVPPLVCPFGTYEVSADLNVAIFQKINGIETDYPMISFSADNVNNSTKTCYISGEGIWRWRIYDYLENENHEKFDEFINKTIQYMALKINKDKFVVDVNKIINENENIIFDAEIYNDTYELVNENDVGLEITDSIGNVFNYNFDKSNKKYILDVGRFPIGDYKYSAKTLIDNEIKTKSGNFSIVKVNIESENTIADHNLLNQLALQNNGKFYYPEQLDSLSFDIVNNDNIVPISYSDKQLTDLLNLKWIFFLILGLLSAEWFFRKFFGGY